MNKIKTLIIDDEPAAVKTLSLMIQHYLPGIGEVESTNDPHEGLFLLKSFQPHLLFIDIQMPLMSGFELLKQVPQISFDIIFTTAHDEYAIEAIRFSALDYLLKPIDADELQNAFNRFIQKQSSHSGSQPLYNNFLYNLTVKDKKDFRLAVPTTQGTFFYKPEEITRLEGESNYTKFFFTNKTTLLTSRTLKEYEEILAGHGFIRIHKSHIINKAHVINYSSDGLLTLSDNSKVEISRRRRVEVSLQLKSL
jgi:two-component system, LytTR family, response regulator